jgi:hypothetical protein
MTNLTYDGGVGVNGRKGPDKKPLVKFAKS